MRLIHKRGHERIAFPLEEGENHIGRKDYCEIYFPDGSLSKRHARLVREGRRLKVVDAGSRNGTYVNGEQIDEVRLRNGDVIQCGKLRFKVEGIPEKGEHEDYRISKSSGRRSVSGRGSAVSGGGRVSGSGSLQDDNLISARAVASVDARPSMLDVLPELPASVEDQAGLEEDKPQDSAKRKVGAKLRLVEGGPEQEWDLGDEPVVTIGSKEENTIVLTGEGVSRYHAELVLEEGQWVLKDLGARNGVFIAGERIVEDRVLKPGDELQIGTTKLRLEVVKPDPLEGVYEAWAGFKADPKHAIKTDPRVRAGLATLAVALILMVMILPGGGAGSWVPGSSSVAHGPWLATGSQAILKGDYKEARDIFRRAKVHVPQHAQQVPKVLERIADQWMDLAKAEPDPFAFRWKKAADQLKATTKLGGLPDGLRDWIAKQVEFVELNSGAYEAYTRAKTLATQAGELARRKGEMEHALETYNQALDAYDKVASLSMFAEKAASDAQVLGAQAFKSLVADLKRRMRSPNPNWGAIVDMIVGAQDFARSPEDRQVLRRLAEEAETNRRDEEYYVQATKLINQRILAKYPEAQRLLAQVDRRSRIYQDAQAYIDWIEADLKVRQAKRAYDIADSRQAFQLLNEALRYEVLGPEARNSVLSRRHHWARVVRAYERGMQYFHDGQTKDAKEEFERVISLEPNARNRFHVRARDQINHLIQSDAMSLEHKLREGLRSLKGGDHSTALKWFAEVRADPNHRERDLTKIRLAVEQVSRGGRLLDKAKDNLLHDRTETFIEIRDTFKLLTLWLPSQHPDRKEARKHLQTVVRRLKNWRSGKGRPR